MTRQSFVRCFSQYAASSGCSRSAWLAQQVLPFQLLSCSPEGDNPSTSYTSGTPSSARSFAKARSPTSSAYAVRRFCSLPAPATAHSHPINSPGTPDTQPRLDGTGHWILDPGSAAEYQRRLRELLSASRSFRDLPPAHHPPPPDPPSSSSPKPRPGPRTASVPPHGEAPSAAAGSDHSGAIPDVLCPNEAAIAAATAAAGGDPARTAAAASPSASSTVSTVQTTVDAAAPPVGAAAAARDRARAALRNAPVFSPTRSTGCSSSSSSSSSDRSIVGAAGAVTLTSHAAGAGPAALAHPRPRPQPHPASPPPMDWREVLQRARQELGGRRMGGAAMLTDKFRRTHTYLRISLTERCNLRCRYCMPVEGVDLTPHHQLLSSPEIMRLARLFVEAGVTKIRLTGGEPTLRRDIGELVRQLGALRPAGLSAVALTSNGLVLGRQLPGLKEAGLTAVNISLDTLRPERFEQLARRPGHKRVLEAIRTAVELGYDPVKVNVVVMRGVNDDEVPDFAALTAAQPLNVRFIEYMPFDGNVWSDSKMVPYRELVSRIQAAFPNTPLDRLDDPAGEVAKNFRLRGHRGSVSFITSMTQHFCGDCNRLRLLADGSLKVCLFGASEVSLRDAIRGGATDDDLRAIIGAAVGRKRAAHAGMFELAAAANRPMITIGG